MKIVADEGVDAQIVVRLRADGHYVWYVAEMSPSVPDTAVLDLANRESGILLTADKDFGDMVFRQHRSSSGVILLRLHGLSPHVKATIVSTVIQNHQQRLISAFTVITEQKVRIRPSR
jgi:predicted nuclease of predicted toxin-antitoxin system